jgi:hypothetical protein
MVSKAPVSTRLDLTQEEMDTIYEKMVDIKFFSYPEAFQPKLSDFITESTPFMVYYLEYRDGDQIKIVRWNTKYVVPEDMKYQELQDLANLIIDMIEDKPEYQKLHEPYGGYA